MYINFAAASSIELRTLNERVLPLWLLIRLEREINRYCYSWIFFKEIITPKVETVVFVSIPSTNGKVNRLLEFPVMNNANHWVEAMIFVKDNVTTQIEPVLIVVVATTIEGHPCVRCPSQIT